MNANHVRAILSGFRAMDRLLADIEAALRGPASSSLFVAPPADLKPALRHLLAADVREVRAAMVEALIALGLHVTPAAGRARGTIQTALSFAEIALQDIAPERLGGYGPLSPGDAVALDRVLSDMARRLRAARASLGDEADFGARLDALGQGHVDVSEIRSIEQVITRRGMVELRGLLASVLAQLEQPAFEIAVFGRVSCGKSSLLNAALRMEVLPVGALPVTAVPTRIEHATGGAEWLEVRFADGRSEAFPLDRIAEYVTEEQNPGNEKGVVRATVRLLCDRLDDGVALVDTPGVAALGAAGSRETYAYLPRCGLGIVAVDAGALLGREDVQLLRMLRDSGIEARVVVTKTDRLSPSDRTALLGYFQKELVRELGTEVPVRITSSAGAESALARDWFDEEIAPLVPRARALAEASMRRKLVLLRDSSIRSLRAALGSSAAAIDGPARRAADQAGGEAERILEEHRRQCNELSSRVREAAPFLVQRIAQALLDEDGDRGECVARTLSTLGTDAAEPMVREVTTARDRLRALVVEAGGAPSGAEELRIDVLGVPVLASVPVKNAAGLLPPRWWPTRLRKHRTQMALVDDLGGPLSAALSHLARDLRTWTRHELDRLSDLFAAAMGPIRARPVASADRDALLADLRALGIEDLGDVDTLGPHWPQNGA
jgi:GTP-binding protein EngB required for normal cell division